MSAATKRVTNVIQDKIASSAQVGVVERISDHQIDLFDVESGERVRITVTAIQALGVPIDMETIDVGDQVRMSATGRVQHVHSRGRLDVVWDGTRSENSVDVGLLRKVVDL